MTLRLSEGAGLGEIHQGITYRSNGSRSYSQEQLDNVFQAAQMTRAAPVRTVKEDDPRNQVFQMIHQGLRRMVQDAILLSQGLH